MNALKITNHKYLSETVELKSTIEQSFLVLAERLYKIRSERLWDGEYDTFDEFLLELDLSAATCSKLCLIYKHWVLKAGVKVEALGKCAWSSLYEAIPLLEKRNPNELAEELKLLTRSDTIEKIREFKHSDCKHKNVYTLIVCKDCGKRVKTYDE